MNSPIPTPQEYQMKLNELGIYPPKQQPDNPKESIPNYGVRPEQFGAVGNGQTNDTQAILDAISLAKSIKEPVIFSGGKTYKFLPSSVVDITGIPEFIGYATIDCTGVNTGSVKALFQIKGTAQTIATGIRITALTLSVNIGSGKDLKTSDFIYVTSNEINDNPDRPNYLRGMLVQVKSYDKATGILVPFEAFRTSIVSATLQKATYMPSFKCDKNLTYRTTENAFMDCYKVDMANVEIHGDYYNFGDATLYIGYSLARITANIFNPFASGQNTNYGIVIVDLSKVIIDNCYVVGGRHAVAGGGTYPCDYEISGGAFVVYNNSGCIDAHGNVWSIKCSDCIIYEGVVVAANYAYFSNCNILFDQGEGFTIASITLLDRSWGHYDIIDCSITSVGPTSMGAFNCKVSSLTRLYISNLRVKTDHNSTNYPFKITADIDDLEINGLNCYVQNAPSGVVNLINVYAAHTVCNRLVASGCEFRFISKNSDVILLVENCRFSGSPTYGVYFDSFRLVEVINSFMTLNGSSGAYILNCVTAIVRGTVMRNNANTVSNTANKTGAFINGQTDVVIQNNMFQTTNSPSPNVGQCFGVYCNNTKSYILQGNDARGCKGGSGSLANSFIMAGTRISQLGNVGEYPIPDFIKT
ncbi:hypothetical protein C3K47_13145 [Solitalea longa]|uniref:Uncharacterized protein n=1 Tax=Solitalea longa TaxID=2079460 RepID=A0A2S5A0S3_9SPHI|nr:right-handed parallel beta-helix repeat-containing protein [Solitalea longa]POY36134.1 hypothetical protein C3K47_13145 [Solitalea longa]